MLLTCPQCRTVYDFPAGKSGVRKVRCAVCKTVWTLDDISEPSAASEPLQEDLPHDDGFVPANSIFDDPDPEPDVSNGGRPELRAERDFRFYDDGEEPPRFDFKASEAESELPADFKIPEFKEPFAPVGENTKNVWQEWTAPLFFLSILCILGAVWLAFFHPVKQIPMTFRAVSYEFTEQDYKKFLIVKASLVNESERFAYPRGFKVAFYSANGRRLADRSVASPLNVLEPGRTGDFELRLERPPAQAAKAELILDTVEFSDQSDLPAAAEPEKPSGHLGKMQAEPVKDGNEDRSPEEGTPERVMPSATEPENSGI